MKRTLLVLNWMVAAAFIAAAQKTPESMLGAALHQEEVQGDLKGAIAAYQKVTAMPGVSRKTVAEALVRMGQCYEKLGNTESRKAYERVVREYADQKESATVARARLAKESGNSHGLAFRQVWRLPSDASTSGMASRDGRYLAYTGWKQNYGNLFLHDFANGQDRRLTNTGTDGVPGKPEQYADESSFSPDGRQLAYSWYREDLGDRYELRIMDLKGDGIPESRSLFENPDIEWIAPDDWSPDGKWIAVRIQRKDKIRQLGLVSATEGSLRVLKSIDWRGASRPFFSPDGRYLGYDRLSSDSSQQRDVFVMAVDGSREIPAVVHRAQDLMMGWSPDGKRLLFASDRLGSMDLWTVPFADGKLEGEPELAKSDVGRAEAVGLTRAGALYLTINTGASQQSNIQIASFDFDSWKLLSNAIDVSQDYLESNLLPEWSADGKYLAYISVRGRVPAANTLLVIRSAETRQLVRELPVRLSDVYWNRWAPDGRSLMLGARDLKGRWGVFKIDAQTGDVSPLIVDPRVRYPMWSRDGKSVYFSRHIPETNERALIERDLTSGNEKELLRRSVVVANRMSPDGRYFTVDAVDFAAGSSAKLLIPTDGGEPREIMHVSWGTGPESWATFNAKGIQLMGGPWAPDGRSVVVTKYFYDRRERELWRVPIDGSAPVKVSVAGQVQPGGKQIALATTEKAPPHGTEVWVLENFLLKATRASK